ncbi:hypothetical protein BSZ18_16005 [Bradyrhizobium canariense]|uniref:Uncharacterized protein n=1 Tax=Bradyrhizobium canariense TaxID=255045 RepID=A0A1X3H7T4_9BRAD|nr:hypothetical protein BSZ25_13890 [Bradyrhizobium canariense]OSJ05672.1 hypothetical protein BSZ16_11670 [Bradyrhizobium canariense]OSJ10820.1 hypothetical protein BSZ18_16005 [Bradyrhizobium canariense]
MPSSTHLLLRSRAEFGKRQHSIVQGLLRALRRKTAEQLGAEEPLADITTAAPPPGLWTVRAM